MLTSYRVIIEGDHIRWIDVPPTTPKSIEAQLTFTTTVSQRKQGSGKRMAAILQALSERNVFANITDPVAWQRELRKDRPLFGREDK